MGEQNSKVCDDRHTTPQVRAHKPPKSLIFILKSIGHTAVQGKVFFSRAFMGPNLEISNFFQKSQIFDEGIFYCGYSTF
eukprot:TRINITY_DN4394_c0_g1_i1.p2 TRINITY_DN4394_c0_g1~~TRINITY_DN4394_c0_g1_i1.p2  ORF type:complete len:79 (+),score=4.52 TRINITY_DN4394_c0_g1_i1:764-1000(+)